MPKTIEKPKTRKAGHDCKKCGTHFDSGTECPLCNTPLKYEAGVFSGHATSQAEPATNPEKFMKLFMDDSKWQHVKGVPVFDEHSEQYAAPGPDGKPVTVSENFDRARLQRIADNCNRLVASGSPVGLSFGHTVDKGPESSQPETLGYASNYRVEMHPQLNRACIYQDERYYPDKYETAKTLPFRSVERWKPNAESGGDYFKPVALLRREPRRPLGPVAYEKPGFTVIRYSMDLDTTRYAMPEEKIEEKVEKPAAPAAAEPAAPTAAGAPPAAEPPVEELEPSPKDHALYAKLCAKYDFSQHPQIGPLLKKMAMPTEQPAAPPAPAAPGAPPVQMAMGAPSASNVSPPSMGAQHMSADTSVVERYESEIANLRRELDENKTSVAGLQLTERVARYGRVLDDLERQGFPVNTLEEVTRCQNYTQAQFDQHCADIKRYGEAARRPVGPAIRVDGSPHPQFGKEDSEPLTKDQMEVAVKYMDEKKHQVPWTEAMKYARQECPVR